MNILRICKELQAWRQGGQASDR